MKCEFIASSVLDPSAWRRMLTGVESQARRMWFHWYACFFWYAAFEIGFSAWISPFATLLELVEDESTAALLTTCYYIPFTITRTSGLFLARQFNSVQLFRAGFTGALLSLIIVGLSGSVGSPMMLWGGTAMVGMFCGPLWPASMSLLTEMYGVELKTPQVAATQILTKISIAGEQFFFAVVLSDAETAPYFVHACAAVLIIAGFSHYSMMKLTAATGLELTPKAKENVARGSAWSRFLAWVAEF